jgi:hypothetical protein
MSVPKKSLIGSRPTEKKATTKPVTETAIGESKGLAAKALTGRYAKINKTVMKGTDIFRSR